MDDKILEVKKLTISFRTTSGILKAVRNISFNLHRGETLAIVGESGSGKSVTSKAIMGILAGNSIVEGGEILYDGQDLLKISEDDFYRIRGDKIAMIFQDPLSSLNPIMRIGKQLTEAMLLKGKAKQKSSRIAFNTLMKHLNRLMIEALAKDDAEKAAALTKACKNFDTFEFKHIELEQAYNRAKEAAGETSEEIANILFHIEKNAFDRDQKRQLKAVCEGALDACHRYVVYEKAEALREHVNSILAALDDTVKTGEYASLVTYLASIKAILDEALTFEMPNFFALGYYMTFGEGAQPDQMSVPELNKFMRKYLDDHFMLEFIDNAECAVRYSADRTYEAKTVAAKAIREAMPVFMQETYDKAEVRALAKKLSDLVKDAIDPLEIHKDSASYTFATALDTQLDAYFRGITKNQVEQRKFDKRQAKYNQLVEAGKKPSWEVQPAALVDLDLVRDNIATILEKLASKFERSVETRETREYHEETIGIIDFLKYNASSAAYKVTPAMARRKALKLMEEVGIPEPRRRYHQYPFEFSGGMRQRIVIAIALAANPDILICDEPTTALDVTIQSQILELINRLKAERNLSIIFITHNLGVVANMADRIAVMYAGKIVEQGTSEDVFYSPAHPYTWALLSSMPDLETKEKLEAIPGTPPNMIYPPKGDAFADRNRYALEIDYEMQPPMFQISDTHYAATWLLHPNAPKVDPPKMVTDRIERMKKLSEGGQSHE